MWPSALVMSQGFFIEQLDSDVLERGPADPWPCDSLIPRTIPALAATR